MSESVIIGVDHGYAAMKTAHFSFHTGLVAHEHEPYTLNNVLEYGGKYYVVGSGRQPLQKDKTQTEDYYLLTLAAVAKEMAYRNAGTAADIHLAAGLPLTSFGRDKKAFRDYLCRGGKPVSFRYEGQDYVITISKVSLYPQGYAAALTQGSLLDEPSVIVADIGGWTVDLMRLDNRIPNASTCRSLELGMIRCLDEIGEQIRRGAGSVHDGGTDGKRSARRCQPCERGREKNHLSGSGTLHQTPALCHRGERSGRPSHACCFSGRRCDAAEASCFRRGRTMPSHHTG